MNEELYAVEVARWYETEDDVIVNVVESGFNYDRASVLDIFEKYGLDVEKSHSSIEGYYGGPLDGVDITVYKRGGF